MKKKNRLPNSRTALLASGIAIASIAAVLVFPGCITTDDKDKKGEDLVEKNIPEEEKENRFFKKNMVAAEVKSEPINIEAVSTLEVPTDSTKEFEGFKTQIDEDKKQESGPGGKPFYEKFLEGDDGKPIPFSPNLDALEISTLAEWFSGPGGLGFSYMIDPRVKNPGAVSMSINTQLTRREIWQLFEQILWLTGAYCAPGKGNIINIYPLGFMAQQNNALGSGPSNVEVRLIPLKYTASNAMVANITPFLSEGAKVQDITAQNSILVVESPENFGKIEALVKMLDKKTRQEWPELVLNCRNMMASTIRDELLAIMPILGFPVAADNAAAEPGAVQITANDRLQVLVASAANMEALNELKKWVGMLDRSDIGEQERVFVYKVINGKADELLSAISAIFNTEGTSASSKKSASSLTTSGMSNTRMGGSLQTINPSNPPKQTAQPPQTQQPTTTSSKQAKTGDQKSTSIFDVPSKIFADGVHNRLIVRTTPRTYAMIKALLERLDTIPAQVLLQVLIAEVVLNESTQFGIEFSNLVKYQDSDALYGTKYIGLDPEGKDQYGFKYWIQNSNNPEDKFAYIRAAAGDGNTKVLSSPQIIAVSDTEAKIQVGDQVPVLTQGITNSSSSGDITQNYQYVDTGIILTIKPQITEGGLIVLELNQEISDAVKTQSSDIKSPTIQKRNFNTRLAIRDGGTLIVGGLIWEKNTLDQNSLPLITKIPLLAALTGYSDIQKKRVELLVIITGNVITEKTDLEEMAKRYEQAMQLFKERNK